MATCNKQDNMKRKPLLETPNINILNQREELLRKIKEIKETHINELVKHITKIQILYIIYSSIFKLRPNLKIQLRQYKLNEYGIDKIDIIQEAMNRCNIKTELKYKFYVTQNNIDYYKDININDINKNGIDINGIDINRIDISGIDIINFINQFSDIKTMYIKSILTQTTLSEIKNMILEVFDDFFHTITSNNDIHFGLIKHFVKFILLQLVEKKTTNFIYDNYSIPQSYIVAFGYDKCIKVITQFIDTYSLN